MTVYENAAKIDDGRCYGFSRCLPLRRRHEALASGIAVYLDSLLEAR